MEGLASFTSGCTVFPRPPKGPGGLGRAAGKRLSEP